MRQSGKNRDAGQAGQQHDRRVDLMSVRAILSVLIKGGMKNAQEEMKRAVDCGYWNLYRFNPAAPVGKKFTLDSKEPKGGYQEFLMNEARYSRLTREFPDRAQELFDRNEADAMARWQHLAKLKDLYAEV